MATITMPVKPKRSTVAGKVPTTADLVTNEIGINYTDRKVYGRSPIDGNIVTLLSSSGTSVGEVIERPTSTTPTGYLRANGGEVSQTTYSALYAVIGNSYNITMQPGNGQPWRQQHAFNTQQSTDITGWTTGAPLPVALGDSQAIVTKNRVYLLGGNTSSAVSTVFTASINSNGTLGTWITGAPLPGALFISQAIVTSSRVYLLGGHNGVWVSTVYTAPINSDGTLGTWITGAPLPGVLGDSQAIVTSSRVYLLGGGNGSSYVSTVYTASINSDGTLGTWTTGTSLPGVLGRSQAIVTKNRVYLLGGHNGVWVSTVYTAPINSDGTLGTWTTGTSLPGVLGDSQAIVTSSRVYLLGGGNGSSFVSTVYTAPIYSDGTLGTWTTGTSLPGVLGNSQPVVTSSRVYLLGGYNGSAFVSTVYTAPFSGGLNDYSPYYNGTYAVTTPGNFRLPDYSGKEGSTGPYYFIKF